MKNFGKVLTVVLALVVAFSCKREQKTPEVFESVMLSDVHFKSKFLEAGEARFNIFLPADYAVGKKKYPVLYLLHGVLDDHTAWNAKGKVRDITDKAIMDGIIEPFIIVMPDGFNGFYVNGAKISDGKQHGNDWESFFWKELKPYIEKNYPVKKGRENTAIAGNSMGGYGSIYYAFNYPSKFCFCYAMSAAMDETGILGSRKLLHMKEIFKKRGYNKTFYNKLPDFIMECGNADIVSFVFNESTHKFLDSVKFPHKMRKNPGSHNWAFWKESYERMLPNLAEHFGKPEKTD